MPSDAVATEERPLPAHGADTSATVLGLVLIWANEDYARVGEVLLPRAEPAVFGRHDPDDPERRLCLVRQRPGKNEKTPPLENVFLSRRQLRLSVRAGEISVECLGKPRLRFNAKPLLEARGVVRPGDTLEIERGYLFLCVERPERLEPFSESHPFAEADAHGLVGESPAAWELRRQIRELADDPYPVLILGPSGSGKELVARALHACSSRRRKAMVARNASTLPPGLIDAELFGNLAQYPNPGMPERVGLFGQAAGSTLFLDEIGELGLELQAHLLRVLREGEYHRLGEAVPRPVECRCLAATNRDPSELKFDLFARFPQNVQVPGLPERAEDIPLLARHILRLIAEKAPGRHARFFEPRAQEPRFGLDLVRSLVVRSYTTHMAELTQLLWSSVLSSRGDRLELTDAEKRASAELPRARSGRDISVEEYREAERSSGGKQARMAELLGLPNRHQVARLRQRLGIEPADKAHGPSSPDGGSEESSGEGA